MTLATVEGLSCSGMVRIIIFEQHKYHNCRQHRMLPRRGQLVSDFDLGSFIILWRFVQNWGLVADDWLNCVKIACLIRMDVVVYTEIVGDVLHCGHVEFLARVGN
jgi:hypothetical protein